VLAARTSSAPSIASASKLTARKRAPSHACAPSGRGIQAQSARAELRLVAFSARRNAFSARRNAFTLPLTTHACSSAVSIRRCAAWRRRAPTTTTHAALRPAPYYVLSCMTPTLPLGVEKSSLEVLDEGRRAWSSSELDVSTPRTDVSARLLWSDGFAIED